MAPVTAGVLTAVVAASAAVAGQLAHKTDPVELNVALPQPRASVSGSVATNHPLVPHDDAPDADFCPCVGRIERHLAARPDLAKAHDSAGPVQVAFVVACLSLPSIPAQFRDCFRGCGAVSGRLRHGQHVAVGARDGPGLQPAGRRRGAGHRTAGRFEVRDGDTPVDSGERSEAKAPDWTDVSDGDERLVLVLDDVRQVVPGTRRRMVRSDAAAHGERGLTRRPRVPLR